jgi:hypothetical protein
MGVPVFVSSGGTMMNQAFPLLDKMAIDLKGRNVLAPQRDKRQQGDHQAIPVLYGVGRANLLGSQLALIHQLQPKVEKLKACNDGPLEAYAGAAA